jgi:hypothetical protein
LLGALVLLTACHPAAPAVVVPVCSTDQLLAFAPGDEEIAAHRQFSLPTVHYPSGVAFPESFEQGNFSLTLKVDARGRVACYSLKDRIDKDQLLNDRRREVLAGLLGWRYAPFEQNGSAVDAIVVEHVIEEALPAKHVSLPEVPLSTVHIALERTGCYGSCPAYRVEVGGDGSVTYRGGAFVDVEGEHRYSVPVDEVAKLVDGMRRSDLWSLNPEYQAGVTDSPTYALTFDMDGQVHRIVDYVGRWVGMPVVVTDFEKEVDRVGRAREWVHLSAFAVQRLQVENYKFQSGAGGALLSRAVENEESHDDAAMLKLIELGAPVDAVVKSEFQHYQVPGSLLERALRHQRESLIDPLIARGVLKSDGQVSQAKVDAAFRAAIVGGRLALVQKLWDAGAPGTHPALWFDDVTDESKPVHKRAPVTLLLRRPYYQKDGWEGLAIVHWLATRGCDLKAHGADGRTLLHIATEAGDAPMVRYLLAQGAQVSALGQYGLPALARVNDEEVALLLLEAGSDPKLSDRNGDSLRRDALAQHWVRVVQWLDAHEKWGK